MSSPGFLGFMPAAGSSKKQGRRPGREGRARFQAPLFSLRQARRLFAGRPIPVRLRKKFHRERSGSASLCRYAGRWCVAPKIPWPMRYDSPREHLENREFFEEPDVLEGARDALLGDRMRLVAVLSLVLYRTAPLVGLYMPVMTLNAVVFPAPLGPMRPTISFFPISILRSETAVRPPNFMTTPWVDSIISGIPSSLARANLPSQPGEDRPSVPQHIPGKFLAPHQPPLAENDNDHEHKREDDHPQTRQSRGPKEYKVHRLVEEAQRFHQYGHDDRGDDRSGNGAGASKHDDEKDVKVRRKVNILGSIVVILWARGAPPTPAMSSKQ